MRAARDSSEMVISALDAVMPYAVRGRPEVVRRLAFLPALSVAR